MTYVQSARVYDLIYGFKDYAQEAARIHQLVQEFSQRPCETLLDIATGTGAHLVHLQPYYQLEGLDIAPAMLEVARQRMPDVTFHEANMVDFDLARQFDVITCLFSSIGYVLTDEALNQTVANFARHLNPGGVLIIEPWLTPDVYREGTIHGSFIDEPDIKISRMVRSERDGDFSVMAMHHLVVTPEEGVTHFVETHRMRMFRQEDYLAAFDRAGLRTHFDAVGLIGRGLYIGVTRDGTGYR